MLGYSCNELLNMHISEVDAIDTAEAVAIRSENIIMHGSLRFETKQLHKNGSVIDVEVIANYSTLHGRLFFSFVRDITPQKRIAQELSESEIRFKNLYDNAPIAIGVGDIHSGQMIEVNDSWLNMFGYERDEVIGRTTTELSLYVNCEDRNEIVSIIKAHGKIVNQPIKLRRKNGLVFDVLYSADTVNLNSKPYLQVIINDISESKQIEEMLKKSEEKFSKAFNTSPEAFSITSMDDGTYIEVNDSFLELTGYERHEVIGHTSEELAFWMDIDDRQRFFVNLSKNGSAKNYEVRYRMKNMEERDFLVSCEVVEIAGNQCCVSFIMDITERKMAEDAVKESEYFFKESQRSAFIGSYKADFTANHWKPSEVLSTIFGIDDNYDCSVKGWIDIVHPDDRNMMDQYLREEVMTRKTPFSKEYRIVRKNDGETRWVKGLGEAQFDGNGNMLSLIGTIQDITESKRVEDERTILQDQLIQAQKLESLGVLAGGIAHDFNNLLAVIIGRCSLAKIRPITAIDNIQSIETAAERAAELCQQMLAYAGKAKVTKSQIHLGELVDEMVKMSRSTIVKSVHIISDLASNIPPILADASQIRQIAMNLIINASEAIGESQGEVRVSLTNKTVISDQHEIDHLGIIIPAGFYACLEVTDNGIGMDDETRQRIFEPFFTTKFTGRGLGMSAVLGIIKAHKGAMQLFSKLGQGTTFKVYLPIQTADTLGEQTSLKPVSSESWKGNSTILLVEDEEQLICVAEAMLEELGFNVIKANNGKEALDLYQHKANEITLVVTDIGMPVMDGYALINELKRLNPAIPIIISSGFGDTVVTSRIAHEDIAGLISKPYRFDQLQKVLKSVFDDMMLTNHTL